MHTGSLRISSLLTLLVITITPPLCWGLQKSWAYMPAILPDEPAQNATTETEPYRRKTRSQLRKLLTPLQYQVTQNEATEPAFDNLYWNNKKPGKYLCIVCEQPLFSSQTKFESGTGWPSFFEPLNDEAVGEKVDYKLFYPRREVHCSRCRAHLGHVFEDGPPPTGLRYCMNSASLKFVDEKKPEDDTNPSPSNLKNPSSPENQSGLENAVDQPRPLPKKPIGQLP